MTTVHPFEKAGLGKAPFRCVGMSENWYVTGNGSHRQPGGCCEYCGTGILYEYTIKDSEGKTFVVGSDCVEKTDKELTDFKRVKREFKTKQRIEKKRIENAAKAAEIKAEHEAKVAGKIATFNAEHPSMARWLNDYKGDVPFILSIKAGLAQYGSPTINQLIAVSNFIDKEARLAGALVNSTHVGVVGETTKNIDVRVVESRYLGSTMYSGQTVLRFLVKMETAEGSQIAWFTNREHEVGEEYKTVSFKVKEHNEFRGVKQTVVQYVKGL